MALVRKTRNDSNINQRQIRRLNEFVGPLDSFVDNETVWGQAGGIAEETHEVRFTEPNGLGHQRQRQIGRQIAHDEVMKSRPLRGAQRASVTDAGITADTASLAKMQRDPNGKRLRE